MQEVWKDIKELKCLYQVSNLGNVRKISGCKNYRIMKLHKTEKGYLKLKICIKGERSYFRVHRLVAEAFIPNPLNKPQVNHLDGNKENNKVFNLEWCTDEENRNHAIKNNLVYYREKPIALLKNGVEIARYKSISQAIRETKGLYGVPTNIYYVGKKRRGICKIYQWVWL